MPINPPASLPGLVPTPAPIPAAARAPSQAPAPAAISMPVAGIVAAPMPASNPTPMASPTPAPIQMPISTPGAVPVAQFPSPMQQPVKIPAPLPQTPVTMTAESYKQELTKISGDIDSINTLKATLKAQLSDLDDQLAQTQTTLSEIKKLSFDILNKEDEKQAAQALETMKQSLASIQQVQKTVETTTVQEFNTTVQKIRVLMASVQAQLQVLENKSNMLKTAAPSPAPATTPTATYAPTTPFGAPSVAQPSTQPPVTTAPAPVLKVEDKTSSERSLIHQFFNATADIITGSIIMIVSVIKSIKEMIMPAQPTITELEHQKEAEELKKKIASSVAAPKIATSAPVATPNFAQAIAVPQAPLGSSTFENEVKANIATIEQVVKKLDDQRFSIKQMVGDIKKQSKNLRKRVEQNAYFEKSVSRKLSFDEERQADVWKKKAGDGFETLLNWIDTVVTTVKNIIVTLYDAMHQGISKGWKAIAKERTPSEASRGK